MELAKEANDGLFSFLRSDCPLTWSKCRLRSHMTATGLFFVCLIVCSYKILYIHAYNMGPFIDPLNA